MIAKIMVFGKHNGHEYLFLGPLRGACPSLRPFEKGIHVLNLLLGLAGGGLSFGSFLGGHFGMAFLGSVAGGEVDIHVFAE